MRSAIQTLECAFVVLVGLALVYALSGCGPSKPPCHKATTAELVAKQVECQARVKTECPDYVRGTCSTEFGAPCPQCRAVEECNRWIESKCR